MYEWIVDGLSSLFVPFSEGKNANWPTHGNPSTREAAAPETQGKENCRPAKRHYQSVYSPDGKTEHLEIKRPRRDVIVSIVKKTVSGIAGFLRLRHSRPNTNEKYRLHKGAQLGRATFMGIDEIQSCHLNTQMWSSDVKMEKPKEVGSTNKERNFPNCHSNPQPLTRKHDGVMFSANHERPKDRTQRRSLQLTSTRPALGVGMGVSDSETSSLPPPTRTHKACLTVEEALKESDREHYRKLVEMVSEKYSTNKPLPFGRVKTSITTLSLDGHKSTSLIRTTDISRPGLIKANPNVSVWRETASQKQPKDRVVDVTLTKKLNAVRTAGVEGQTLQSVLPVDVDLSAQVASRLNLNDRDRTAAAHCSAQARPDPLAETRRGEDEFPRLGKEMLQEVSAALAQRDPNLVLSSAFKLRITQRDLATLQEGSWLNDEVINFYLNLVMARSEQDSGGKRVYSFSTFFFPKLHTGGHAAVRRWTKAVDLFTYDAILVPLHLGVHWSLAVVDFKSKSVRSYDSMGQRHDDICNLILRYLKEECKAKRSKDLDITKWTVTSLKPTEIPQQRNGSDCGVFACKYADYIARGHPLTFRQCHMPYFRKAMIWEILNQKLL
ncbi:sentrin-specific protease 2 [Chanos chanos]|uniref:Sentrin-specific protease 2 n=1 Tax=Chanos chanos TaxID=29144 RepID=A0A6J2W255_CHACN|nr:sentrin-specific protease 2-like [Chanos chanos]